ncbi:hypothetical protein [Halorussus amylolyticus]|uniref:hypothetical protein n=1 Tax=Halorussus amylolyticus TaxID=1126242 RepID=UPI00104D085E|nr:hypothetical protein [Halorussus amylolyticus]
MRKRDALSALALLTGGLLALPGESAVVAAPMLAACGYLLAGPKKRPTRGGIAAKFESLRKLGALRALGARSR